MKYRIYRPSGHDEMVRVPEDEDGGGYGYVYLCEMLDAEMEIAKLEDELIETRIDLELAQRTLNAVIEYTELSEQDIEQAKFEAGCD